MIDVMIDETVRTDAHAFAHDQRLVYGSTCMLTAKKSRSFFFLSVAVSTAGVASRVIARPARGSRAERGFPRDGEDGDDGLLRVGNPPLSRARAG